ncbi:MAG: epoxyqueuosine reductase [Desulforhopalus sp.]|jgi:epoxyqueuosine reductase
MNSLNPAMKVVAMASLEKRLKSLAMSLGADVVGITTTEILANSPPSADPRYLLPSANSVISFAVSLDEELTQDFISKRSWWPHCENRKAIGRTLYRIGDTLTEQLRSEGYEAINVDLNNNYRPEEAAADVTEMTEFIPEFSHRYAAVASGVGRLGWSGNLVTPKYGALVELGSVITTANLVSDTPIPDDEHPCDKCKICSQVCPVEMIHPKAATQVTVAGITETISTKRPNTCCWIGCTGYEGLSTSATWSNWSPYRLGQSLPENKKELDALCISLQKSDPQMQDVNNSFANYREAIFDPDWFYSTVCGFCRSVCSPNRKDRIANRSLITHSGTAALKIDGSHVVTPKSAVEVKTPFGVNVVVEYEGQGEGQSNDKCSGQFSLDRAVIKYLLQRTHSVDTK